jgi:hypothetical protein
MTDPSVAAILAQYGAVGLIALIALVAVRVLFKREVSAHDEDRARADRLEAELRTLNQLVRDQYIGTLAQATRAISEANDAVREALQLRTK